MESPVVLDKPPEYHANERGFPFDEEDGAWSELASRHPDIAARLRQRPATWARKRRPSSQDTTDDFGDSFGGFDRFPFDDIPPEFREHLPSHWNRRFGSREEQPTTPTHHQPQPPQQQTTATQTEHTEPKPGPSDHEEQQLPQYGLRNTVDLGQKSPADPSLVDAEDRTHRSMSAPPDNRSANKMSGQHQDHSAQQEQSSNVRHIPIFVEGRDEPVINKRDHGTHFGETKQTYAPPPQPHIDRDQYFADDTPHGFHHPPNFSRAFGTPFNKGFRQGPQPFSQQKMYPQTAFTRGASPQRSQSPKPQMHPEEHFVKVPVYHDQPAPPSKPQPKQPSPQRASPSPKPPQPSQQTPQAPTKPKPQPAANDPITQILSIQSDVLNLMTEVENFTGNKTDKRYIYLDEMLTRNLIKLDNIETDGKENIRQARREAIKCIQKCINVLEAKAEQGSAPPQPQDVDMQTKADNATEQKPVQNGDVEMKETPQEEVKAEQVPQPQSQEKEMSASEPEKTMETEPIVNETAPVKSESTQKIESTPAEVATPQTQAETEKAQLEPMKPETPQPDIADTRPIDTKTPEPETKEIEKESPKKVTKVIKKRDKSKDKTAKEAKDTANKEAVKDNKEADTDSNKQESIDKIETPVETKGNGDCMEVDGGASQ